MCLTKKNLDDVCLVFRFVEEDDYWFVDLRKGFHFRVLESFLEYVDNLDSFVGMTFTIEQENPDSHTGGTITFVLGSPETHDSHRVSIDVDYLIQEQKKCLSTIGEYLDSIKDSVGNLFKSPWT